MASLVRFSFGLGRRRMSSDTAGVVGAAASAVSGEAGRSTETPSSHFEARSMTVADVLSLKGERQYTCFEDDLVFDAVKEMVKHNIGSLVVVDRKTPTKPIGIVTERDYLEKVRNVTKERPARDLTDSFLAQVIVLGRTSKTSTIKQIMSQKNLVWVTPTATLHYCMDLMSKNRVRHIPVVNSDELQGLISIGDIVTELVASHKRVNEAMHTYIGGSY
uniref:CBS domain-containing protein n=1 Tax=Compsopogon caeruleus TaxID=31354 RepID=A0A7S1TF50_9RHOD